MLPELLKDDGLGGRNQADVAARTQYVFALCDIRDIFPTDARVTRRNITPSV